MGESWHTLIYKSLIIN